MYRSTKSSHALGRWARQRCSKSRSTSDNATSSNPQLGLQPGFRLIPTAPLLCQPPDGPDCQIARLPLELPASRLEMPAPAGRPNLAKPPDACRQIPVTARKVIRYLI